MVRLRRLLIAGSLLAGAASVASAQFSGSRGGAEETVYDVPKVGHELPLLKLEVAEGYMTIDGRAEVRVRPTQIRVVLAVTSEGETAQLCQQKINDTIGQLRTAWKKLNLDGDKVVEDFIAVLPRYEWLEDKRGGRELLVEKKVCFRMQSNLHLAVPDEATAQTALSRAFEIGVTDIIAFDYGNPELDAIKDKVRAQALQAAKAKSDFLLGALFKDPPAIINVQEQTTVHYPETLYRSFTNVDDQQVTSGWRDGVPRIYAHRPKNTYYRGHMQGADVQPRELPMHAEITVVSTVRLYYASPAAARPAEKK